MNNCVSIIVPVYNCENYLRDCLKSIESQTYKNIEVIIVNDGSKDDGILIINEFIKKHKNWKLLDQDNQGLSMARNNGFDISKGKYVFFLDSDDEIPNNAIEKLVNCAEKNSSDVVIGNMINYNSSGKYPNYTSKYIKKFDNVSYLKYPKLVSFIHAAGKLYKREAIKNIKFISGVKHEDNYFNLSIYLKKLKTSMITDDVYYHRVREGDDKSITQSLDYNSFKDLLINYNKTILENAIGLKMNIILSKKMINYAIIRIDKQHRKLAKKDMLNTFKLMDSNLSAIKRIYVSFFRYIYLFLIYTLLFFQMRK